VLSENPECNWALILHDALNKKKYGIVNRNGNEFIRNYKRELKNGRGLNVMEASYSALPSLNVLLFQGRRR